MADPDGMNRVIWGQQSGRPIPLTVIIATRNEAANIAEAIESVRWADQILVIDSQSTDKTCGIAAELGAEVHQFHYQGGWPKKRNWALVSNIVRNTWVLILDADERVSQPLRDSIEVAVQQEEYHGFYVNWKFMFLGRWMKYSWSHGWMLRLFRYGTGEYEDLKMRGEGGWDAEVHENIVVRGKCKKLDGLLLHDSKDDLAYWLNKQNEFSTWNAVRRRQQMNDPFPPFTYLLSSEPARKRKWLKAMFLRMPFRPTLTFIWLYFMRLGLLDGKAGFFFCRLRASHELNTSAKMYEAKIRKLES